MDILDFFWTFYLNHLGPLQGYFFWLIYKKSNEDSQIFEATMWKGKRLIKQSIKQLNHWPPVALVST